LPNFSLRAGTWGGVLRALKLNSLDGEVLEIIGELVLNRELFKVRAATSFIEGVLLGRLSLTILVDLGVESDATMVFEFFSVLEPTVLILITGMLCFSADVTANP